MNQLWNYFSSVMCINKNLDILGAVFSHNKLLTALSDQERKTETQRASLLACLSYLNDFQGFVQSKINNFQDFDLTPSGSSWWSITLFYLFIEHE